MNSSPLEDRIRSLGYFSFKTMKNLPLVCEVKDDKSIVVVESMAQKFINHGNNQGQIFATNSVTTYTDKKIRDGVPLKQEQDLEFETIQKGELVCKIENGIVITLTPVVVQINRSGIRNANGEEQYDVINLAKVKFSDKQ